MGLRVEKRRCRNYRYWQRVFQGYTRLIKQIDVILLPIAYIWNSKKQIEKALRRLPDEVVLDSFRAV